MLGGLERLGTVDQRRHQHHAIDADPAYGIGDLGRLYAGELGHAANHRYATAGGIDSDFGHGDFLFGGQRGVLSHRTADHQA